MSTTSYHLTINPGVVKRKAQHLVRLHGAHGRREPDNAERRRCPVRDLQADAEKDSGNPAVPADRGTGQL